MSEHFDLVVIGAGPAGEKGAAQAAYFGKRVAIVERAPEPGGAGVHTGTLPSKTLRETALFLSGSARRLYGAAVELVDRHAAVPVLIARKDAIAAAEVTRERANLARHGVTYVHGEARFADAHTLDVALPDGGTRRLEAGVFLIAVGSRPRRPAELPWTDPDLYDSDGILGLDALPASLAVIGAGVIGCEYACMFAALGVTVTLLDGRADLLDFLDVEVSARLRAAMQRLGVVVRTSTQWWSIGRDARGLVTHLAGGEELVTGKVLFAAGRVGNADRLGLEAAGLRATDRGNVAVDASFRTAVPSIYAAGDVIGFPSLASVSMEQARVAMCHAFDLRYKTAVSPLLPYGIYTIPEVSCVGETERTCAEKELPYVVGRARHADNARGQIAGDQDGLTKLIVHRETARVLGVHVVGERASELVHIGHAVLLMGGTVHTFIEMVFNYPTLAETYKYAAYDALGALALDAKTRGTTT